jgi:hypothetical protein
MEQTVIVAKTIFNDTMEGINKWEHFDLTGGIGNWQICSSGNDQGDEGDDYLWCGIQNNVNGYLDNWNDVATIIETFNLSDYSECYLNFSTYYEILESDSGHVEISPDGEKHWYELGNYTYPSSTWKDESYLIPQQITINSFPIDLYTDNVKIRFRFYSNDSQHWRGWIINDVMLTGDGTELFYDSFDTNDTDFWKIERAKSGDWWTRTEHRSSSSSHSWYCGDDLHNLYEYPTNLINVLQLNSSYAVSLEQAFGANIIFDTWYDLRDGEAGFVEISQNGNNWETIQIDNEPFINGSSNGWITKWCEIPDEYTGAEGGDEILIRFNFQSDNEHEGEGWYIDNVKIVAKIDETPPETTYSPAIDENKWYTSSMTINFNAQDDESGVDKTYYTLDGGSQTELPGSNQLTISADGMHQIVFWSVDNVGNIETHNDEYHQIHIKIDKEKPLLNISKPDNGIFWRDNKIWPILANPLFNWSTPLIIRHITIIADASDATSGIDKVEFYIDDVLKHTDTNGSPHDWLWDETVFFRRVIKITAYDNAGHTATITKEVIIFNINILGSIINK